MAVNVKSYEQKGVINYGTEETPDNRVLWTAQLECDTVADLAVLNPLDTSTFIYPSVMFVLPTTAHIIDGNLIYAMKSDGTWVIQDEASRMNVYTKDETDQLLTDMADAQENVDLAQDARINENADFIAKIIDSGNKNFCRFMQSTDTQYGTTFTVNPTDGTLITSGTATRYYGYRIMGDQSGTSYNQNVPIPRGTYILTGLPEGSSSTTHRFIIGIQTNSDETRTSTSVYDNYIFEVTNDTTRIDLSAYVATGNNSGSHTVWAPMICDYNAYLLSTKFVPYCPTLQELYQMVRTYHP